MVDVPLAEGVLDGDELAQRHERRLRVQLRADRQREQVVGPGAERAGQLQHDVDVLALVGRVEQA